MDLNGFTLHRGYFYRVSANSSPAGEWRGTVDVRRCQSDGTAESVISRIYVPGTFISEGLARDASDAYFRMLIDEQGFGGK